jgi:hypothetical protein
MRFIRKGGRVIPIADNKIGDTKGSHVSREAWAKKQPALKQNTAVSRFKAGYAGGAGLGLVLGTFYGSPLKGAAIGGAVTAAVNTAIGNRYAKAPKADLLTKVEVGAALIGTAMLHKGFSMSAAKAFTAGAAGASRGASRGLKFARINGKVVPKRTGRIDSVDGNVIFGRF